MIEKIKKILKVILLVFIILTALVFWGEKAFYFFEDREDLSWLPCYESGYLEIIEIKGEIVPYIVASDDSENLPDSV